jgi:ribonuclease E
VADEERDGREERIEETGDAHAEATDSGADEVGGEDTAPVRDEAEALEHDDEDESAAAFASLEALERDEEAPILPVRAIDDDEEEHEDEEAADEADSELAEAEAEAGEGAEDEAGDGDAADEAGIEDAEDGAAAAEEGIRKRRRRRGGRGRKRETQQTAPGGPKRRSVMVVNDVPGEECRIAILEDGRLEQVFAERESTATNVGNIYKARVMNVEAAIQAAFVDFGEGQNGFLHISDLHPRYFPGGDRTERVGKKIARRDRPPIQEALKRGQEIIVQVLKEGIGTKGPTLTSYISIPGRLLVMMPQMDKVGVSRKVDDEDSRREMRRILDSLELPEGFGFILRTAGFDRTKTELQRDAIYLQRLWEAMERRMNSTGAPCTLYTESDLLVRTIRDVADDSVEAIVVDSEGAFSRAKTFLQVVAPINAPKLLYWDRAVPVFEAFGVERQIEGIHSRSVPLPSGGALVIDQTEAMVAIDVNSGRSRSARDSETNAFNTNKEAVDEIARQLRLRDLGGIIVSDLIDMRSSKHRREIEERLEGNLRRDRAKTTTLEISDFGIMEMTRQRMRPGLHKTSYTDCPHCQGSGEVRVPDAVAADILRRIGLLFSYDKVARVEVVCSARVAGVFLGTRRHMLHDLEERHGKRVDLRISEAFAMDRIDLYAYDDRGSDIEIDRLPRIPAPRLAELPAELPPVDEADDDDGGDDEGGGRRRRKRRRKPAPADATAIALAGGFDDLPTPSADEPSVSEMIRRADAEREVKRREDAERRKAEEAAARAARTARAAESGDDEGDEDAEPGERAEGDASNGDGGEPGEGGRRKRRRRRRRRGKGGDRGEDSTEPTGGERASDAPEGESGAERDGDDDGATGEGDGASSDGAAAGEGTGRKRRRRRRGGRGRSRGGDGGGEGGGGNGGGGNGGDRSGEPRGDRGGRGEGNGDREGRRAERPARSEGDGGSGGGSWPPPVPPAASAPGTEASPLDAAKKTIRSVTGWMRRLKSPTGGGRDDR